MFPSETLSFCVFHSEGGDSSVSNEDKDRSGASAGEADGTSDGLENSAGPATGSAQESHHPAKEAQELREKLAETTDKMLRIAADFENTRKRWDRERGEVRSYAISEFARDLLPVIDAFDSAMNAIEQSSPSLETEEGKKVGSIVDGVKLVSKVFLDTLKKHGVERIPAKGEAFNPLHHNAVARVVDGNVTHDTVLDEFAAGYKIADRVLRTAMVRVATPD